jgi:hypothetical protein
MTKLLIFLGTTVGSAVGWWVGAKVGIMTALMLSMVGFGLGMYYGRKAAQHYDL